MAPRTLITGAAGFIGYHLARHLLATTESQLTLADNLRRGTRDQEFAELLKDPRVTFIEGDLTNPATWRSLGTGYTAVYHLAAINGTRWFYERPLEVLRTNALTLLHALDWLAETHPRAAFLFTSSNETYAGALAAFGQLPIPTPESVPLVIDDPYNPRWSYAQSKGFGELCVIHAAKASKLRACIVRPHNLYGPRAGYDHVIPEFCLRIDQRVSPFTIHGATHTRAFCYIDDAVDAMQQLMGSSVLEQPTAETVHIGDATEVTIQDLAEQLFGVAGWRPAQLDLREAPAGSVTRRCPDEAKIRRLTGWTARTSLTNGLRATYAWYHTHPQDPAQQSRHSVPA